MIQTVDTSEDPAVADVVAGVVLLLFPSVSTLNLNGE